MKTSIKIIGLLAALAVGLTSPLLSQVPDLTKDGVIAAKDLENVLRFLGQNPSDAELQVKIVLFENFVTIIFKTYLFASTQYSIFCMPFSLIVNNKLWNSPIIQLLI